MAQEAALKLTPLDLTCDRCGTLQPTARSYSAAGVRYTLCDPCREEFHRPETPDRPRDPRDVSLEWLL